MIGILPKLGECWLIWEYEHDTEYGFSGENACAVTVAAPITHTGARIVRLSHRNMQPPGEPPRKMEWCGGRSLMADLD